MYSPIVEHIRSLFHTSDVIPLHAPCFIGNEKAYLADCVDSTYVSSVGKYVDLFEEKVAAFTGAKKAVACVNGTSALHLALKLAGVEANDEVITQPLTFIATANAIAYCNAHPVFLDVDRSTMGLSPDAVVEWLQAHCEIREGECYNKQTGRKVKACLPMHTFGHPARIKELIDVCAAYHIELVEDAAESLGSFYGTQHTGTLAKIGALSFNGNKIVTTGGGGMLLFQDEALASHAKHLTTQAKVPHTWEFVHDEVGYNYRMPNINAALGCAQMEQLPLFVEKKRQLAADYAHYFASIGVDFVREPENCKSNYWLNAIVLKDRAERDAFLQYTNSNGVTTRPIWRLMSKLPMFQHCQTDSLENATWLEDRVVNIPSSVIL